MFSFFKKRNAQSNETSFDYSAIAVDMHSHVLPGIDDGAKTPADSIALIKKMMAVGIKKIIATPHVMADYYKNTPETIGNALDILKAELAKQSIEIEIEAAAEHYFDETFETRINNKKLFTMGDNYALFEFSFLNRPASSGMAIKKMVDSGYKPILAHPERYGYLDIEDLSAIRGWGCNLQINTISLTGYYGKDIKKKAESMIDADLVDFISSDMHHLKHAEAFKNALSMPYLRKLLVDYPLKNILLK